MNVKIIKSKRNKNSRVRIKPSGEVVISVPYYFTDKLINETYLKFLPWINKHYNNAIDISLTNDIKDNGFIYLLGNKVTIHLINDKSNYCRYNNDLYIYHNDLKDINKILNDFIDEFRNKIYNEIINKYLAITNFKLDTLIIKDMKSSYGKCYKDLKKIVLSKYNIHKRYEFNEAVIVHELCHLKECNHKKEFYDLVYKYYPNYKDEIKRKVN